LINIVIYTSGRGSNALKIIEHFENHSSVKVTGIFTNKSDAGVIDIAIEKGIRYELFSQKDLNKEKHFLKLLDYYKPDYLILAGFLLLLPEFLINKFERKILNIHPSLLPKFGGKGMYGHFVHQAVYSANEKETGMTIHLVNKEYDKGEILFQSKYTILEEDTPTSISMAVLALEHKYYPRIIEEYIKTNSNIS
jgi:phosphoribosylglycinamide formyltransferase-1